MFYHFRKGKNTTEKPKKKKICAAYEEGTMTDQTHQKGFAKFCAGYFSLDGPSQLVDQLNLIAITLRH